jgi:hypothetical protein
VGLNSLKSLNLTNGYPNKNKNKNKNNNKVKSKPLELRSRVKIQIIFRKHAELGMKFLIKFFIILLTSSIKLNAREKD